MGNLHPSNAIDPNFPAEGKLVRRKSKIKPATERAIEYIEMILSTGVLPPKLALEGKAAMETLNSANPTCATSVEEILAITHQIQPERDTQTWLQQQMVQDLELPLPRKMMAGETPISIEFDQYQFNVFAYPEASVLSIIAAPIFDRYTIFESFDLSRPVFTAFINKIAAGYLNTNPYHSQVHAADVLQTCHAILTNTNLRDCMSLEETFALLLAAVIHDYKHPGVNNQFLINTSSDLAILYNDRSVLENHHIACAFKEMEDDKCNVLACLPQEEYSPVRARIIALVLSTDIAHHFDSLTRLNDALEDKSFDLKTESNLIMELTLKFADVSNPTKKPTVYKAWADRIFHEFYRQGRMERETTRTISTFMDEEHPSVVKFQLGFIDFIVRPLVDPFIQLLGCCTGLNADGLRVAQTQMNHNRRVWMSVGDKTQIKFPSDLDEIYFRDNMVQYED